MFPRVYPITDFRLSGLSHAQQVERLIEGGATLVQLREKELSPSEFFYQAKSALALARKKGTRIIINDRADVAAALGADGVHLGQDDLPPEAARQLLGPAAIIGFSTHNLEQARKAATLPIDYLAIGPIFKTGTKTKPDPVVGLEGIRTVRAAVDRLTLVAIGGITFETAREVLAAGADSVAIISALVSEPDEITGRTSNLLSHLSSD